MTKTQTILWSLIFVWLFIYRLFITKNWEYILYYGIERAFLCVNDINTFWKPKFSKVLLFYNISFLFLVNFVFQLELAKHKQVMIVVLRLGYSILFGGFNNRLVSEQFWGHPETSPVREWVDCGMKVSN